MVTRQAGYRLAVRELLAKGPGPEVKVRREYRLALIELLGGGRCDICKTEHGLLIHHMDHNAQNPAIQNLRVLCGSCHAVVHGIGGSRSKNYDRVVAKIRKRLLKWVPRWRPTESGRELIPEEERLYECHPRLQTLWMRPRPVSSPKWDVKVENVPNPALVSNLEKLVEEAKAVRAILEAQNRSVAEMVAGGKVPELQKPREAPKLDPDAHFYG